MKFVVSDDLGALKTVECAIGSIATDKDSVKPAIKILSSSTESSTHSSSRSNYIQQMCFIPASKVEPVDQGTFAQQETETICVARKGGAIEIVDTETGVVRQTVETGDGNADAFVSLEYRHGYLSSCTASGHAVFRNLETHDTFSYDLPSPVSIMRVHPEIPGIIAFGGKETELQIWVSRDASLSRATDDDEKASPEFSNFSPYWKAKNVKNDELDLRVPVWISDIQFLDVSSPRHFKLVISTRFHQIRVYDTKAARRPIMNQEVGQYPIVTMALSNAEKRDEVILADTHSTVSLYSLSKKCVLGHYKGASGAISSVSVPFGSKPAIVATGGLDSYLRAYDLQTRQMLGSVYLGEGKTTCVLAYPEEEPVSIKRESEDEAEDVWNGIESVGDGQDQEAERGHASKRVRL